jgi:ribonuclease D
MLHALFVFRDECARQANTPSFKIMHDSTMVRFVLAQPKSMTELKKIRGLNRSFLKRHGRTILTLLNTPYSDSPPQPEPKSSNKRLNGTDIIRYEHLRGWRNNLAQERGVEPDVILSNGILKAIAKANPKTYNQLKAENILGKWQFKTYAEEIIEELRNCPC